MRNYGRRCTPFIVLTTITLLLGPQIAICSAAEPAPQPAPSDEAPAPPLPAPPAAPDAVPAAPAPPVTPEAEKAPPEPVLPNPSAVGKPGAEVKPAGSGAAQPPQTKGTGSEGAPKGKVGAFTQASSSEALKTIEEMNKAIEDDPTDAGAFDQRGGAYIKLEQFDLAIKDFNQAIKLDPSLATAFANRGYAYYRINKLQEALKDLNEAIRLNPVLAVAYTYRGNVYAKLEQYQKSMADINKGLALQHEQQHDSGSLLSRCKTEYLMGNYKAAFADASAAIRRDPRNPVGYDNRGLCEHQFKQYQAAIKDYNMALSLKPHEPKYLCHRAISYAEQGQHEKAIPDYNEAIKLKPNFALAYYDRAITYYLMHRYEQAAKDMQQAIKYDPHYALAIYELPLDTTKGAKDVKKIVDPNEYYYRATTGLLMVKNQRALGDLKKYLEMTNWRGNLAVSAVILAYIGFSVNHQTNEAEQVLTAATTRVDPTQWPYPVVSYLRHELKEEELIAQAGEDKDKLTDAHAYIGVNMILNGGDHKQAVQHMMWAKQKGNPDLVSYSLAVKEIEKIQFKKHRETERT